MIIALSILLGAVGAILRYAVSDQVDDVDLRMIGLILMIAGAVGLVAGLIQLASRRRVVTEVRDAPVREVRRVD